jgi:hypothetical protein
MSWCGATGVALTLAFGFVGCGESDDGQAPNGAGGGVGADASADQASGGNAPDGGEAGNGGDAGEAAGSGGTAGVAGNDAGNPDGPDADCATTCTGPGQVCINGQCVDDCRLPGAVPCNGADVCDVGSEHEGQCVSPGDGCVISSATQVCVPSGGGTTLECGPGTLCDGDGHCFPRLPCASMQCEGSQCWGTSCSCTRPAPACSVAPLGTPGETGTLNDFVFTRCGTLSSCDGGIFDLDFDQACNAWGVTMISGPDYLRKIDPAGLVTEFVGVTNLNMGEVATIKGKEGEFGGGLTDVSLSYICCSTCGCQISGSGGEPQGVAELDPGTSTLPMRIPSTQYTTGAGPFGFYQLDTGPYGLAWGLDRVLYVGNIEQNGDFHALDLASNTKQVVATLTARVYAAAPFNRTRMVVGVAGGEVKLVPVLGAIGTVTPLIKLADEITSIARDPWSGRVYASLANLDIVSFSSNGTDLQIFQVAPALGRIALAPDGYLYHLTIGWPTQAEIVRWPLPDTL